MFREEKLDKQTLSAFKKHTEKVQSFILPQKIQTTAAFNMFSLSDALGERDKKRLWVLYQKGKFNGVSPEEAHGILFWGVKSIHLAHGAQNAEEAELNPFVFKKVARFASNYTTAELDRLSMSLIALYHSARRGMIPLDIALERFILSI